MFSGRAAAPDPFIEAKMADTVLTEVDSGTGIVTLNRPERHNAFDEELIAELADALQDMEADPAVRVVVLSSTGKSFCAGADLAWMQRAAEYSEEENYQDAASLAGLLRMLNELNKPTIARVQGPAYGGGVGLLAACDIAVATFDAHFSLTEVRLGLIPAVISPYVIAAVGSRRARRYMLTGERFSASEAYRIGLLQEIVPGEEELDDAVGELVEALMSGGPHAQGECKALIRLVADRQIDEDVIEATAQRISRVRASDEGREGMAAFLEKRKPAWLQRE
jgi:methylglutaconyl-CoA hydratase